MFAFDCDLADITIDEYHINHNQGDHDNGDDDGGGEDDGDDDCDDDEDGHMRKPVSFSEGG